MPSKIVSGGQTGVDRAALDLAIRQKIPYGGFIPKGRWAEDGRLDDRYAGLTETTSADPSERTEMNITHCDATLILSRGEISGGSKQTLEAAIRHSKPFLHVELDRHDEQTAAEIISRWLSRTRCSILNIAGPRASEDPLIYESATRVLELVFTE